MTPAHAVCDGKARTPGREPLDAQTPLPAAASMPSALLPLQLERIDRQQLAGPPRGHLRPVMAQTIGSRQVIRAEPRNMSSACKRLRALFKFRPPVTGQLPSIRHATPAR